ncbi:hypothetical protein SERLA73DRAFT_180005 [Serpula lacrymans var. lacrymans S7.3]|uniref:Flavin reductase like domain-containing protein n=2 Tax=Serpula lacrymans var. lacrymans TaxID=341189 RepID=F8PV98_SERL3|nr:uncharacterized protein SERLADRAFT_465407 [Serpula lacrymans var. lacrymans S7.9]EGN99790.1 hypothetical protein SERLA73DRAFT_180005 [Serpula lacrymans var. lacrymans S7.3]EGO25363.1 hypothetical protein SERLADRAFT_465407 [Serpula lacrymans var. lacrymans S7.9]
MALPPPVTRTIALKCLRRHIHRHGGMRVVVPKITRLFSSSDCAQASKDRDAESSRYSDRQSSPLREFNASPSFQYTRSPNPSWKLGQSHTLQHENQKEWKSDEMQGWKTWQMDETPSRDIYRLLTSAVVPRPIAFVSTLSANGVPNLAPFSYFSMVAHNPPLISVSFSLSPKRPKDTRENILATKEFTVSIINEAFVEAANATSVEAPADIDEWQLSGLTMAKSTDVNPPWVRESAVGLECELFHTYDICPPSSDEITHTLVLGLIKRAHVRSSVMKDDGTVDPLKLRAVSRLGGNTYARIGEGFEVPRPSWKVMRHEIEAQDH